MITALQTWPATRLNIDILAEGVGFEPTRRGMRQHAFQACALGQTMRSLPGLTDSRRSGWFGNMRPGLDSPDAVLRGTLGVSCSPKPSTGGAECPSKGVEMARLSVGTWCRESGPTQRNLREPGQVREEAALSGRFRVPWGCRAGAGDRSGPRIRIRRRAARLCCLRMASPGLVYVFLDSLDGGGSGRGRSSPCPR